MQETEGSATALQVRESGYRQGTRAVVPESKGQKIKVRLMGWEPGSKIVEGSSADYPVAVIVRDFPEAFPVGTRMRANHDSMCEAGGDIRRIMAKTTSEPWEESDGMYAWAVAKEGEPSDFIRQFADVIGTSISASADVEKEVLRDEKGKPVLDENGKATLVPKRSERGAVIVERFLPISESPYNAIDFVEAPGADGAVVMLATESAKRIVEHTVLREATGFAIELAGKREKTSAANRPGNTQQEEVLVDPKDILALVETKLAEALTPINTFLADEGARRQAEADAQAGAGEVKEAVKAAVITVEAVKAASLPSKIEARLIEAASEGLDISHDFELAKEVHAEAGTAPTPSAPLGIVIESAAASGKSASFITNFGGSR
ncbi:hypothetical protein MRBLMI12_000421 [Microbacterium sp. LMI12-1-1.1]|uniref:hypothetical protein n=1 Tax=Microbacterium sp. LMI12-1-1.1 TaxID=3135225 RepID=UPI00341A0A73